MTDDTPGVARLCSLMVTAIEEIRGLRADLAARKSASSGPRALSADDARMLTPLLPAIVVAMGETAVTVRSLHVAAGARTPAAKALRRALDATGLDPLRMGHLFKRAALSKTPVSKLFVHRIDKSRGCVVFSVDAKRPEHHAAASFAADMQGKITP